MLVEAPQQELAVGFPRRVEIPQRERLDHDYSLQETNLFDQGNVWVVVYIALLYSTNHFQA